MNKEIKKKWIDALLSGDYKQTQEYLRDDEGYCCLGVLCDIFRKDHNEAQWVKSGCMFDFFPGGNKDYETVTLPRVVVEWAELDSIDPDTTEPKIGDSSSLANLNDKGYDFKKIVKVIERDF